MTLKMFKFVVGFMAISITLSFLYINNFNLPKHLLVGKIANSSVLAEACDMVEAGKKILAKAAAYGKNKEAKMVY